MLLEREPPPKTDAKVCVADGPIGGTLETLLPFPEEISRLASASRLSSNVLRLDGRECPVNGRPDSS